MAFESSIAGANALALAFRQELASIAAESAKRKQDVKDVASYRKRTEVAEAAIAAAIAAGGTPTPTNPTTPTAPVYKIKGLAVEGDSQSTVTNGNPNPWPAQFATITGLPVFNYAQSSTSLGQMKDNYAASDHAGGNFNANNCNAMIVGSAGTNDLTNDATTVADLKSNIQQLAAKGKATGYIVYVTTILPRVYDWSSAREAKRVEYNTWLLANATTFCDGVVDFAALLTTATSDLYDGLHPSDSAALKMAIAFKTKVTNASTGNVITGFRPDVVVGEGDGITQSYGISANGFLGKWQALDGNNGATIINIARQGSQCRDVDEEYGFNTADAVGPGTQFVAGKVNALLLMMGTNDIAIDNTSLSSFKNHVQSISTKARATGYKFWLQTILKRTGGWNASREAVRTTINDWIIAGAEGLVDGIVNNENVEVNATNFSDGITPTPAGNALIAANIDAAFKAKTGTGTTTPVTTVDSTITTNGTIDNDKYRALAAKMSRAEGVAYRFGPQAPTIANKPTYYQPGNHPWPQDIVGTHSGEWQLGTFRTYDGVFQGGDFASNIMWLPYVADDPANWIGLLEVQATSTDHGTFTQKPELSWVRYGGGENAVEAVWWKNTQGKTLRNPVCSANTLDRPGWGTQCITFFQDGFFCTTGANTMTNKSSGQLPAGLVPVACCVTGANGFCLVVCWDTTNLRGVLVAISLCGLGHDATLAKPNNGRWWDEWIEPHPGLHNLGNLVFMKVLGVMPLPGMMAPTGISASTQHSRFGYLDGSEGEPSCYNQAFSNESIRQNWLPGRSLERAYIKQAECMVISRTEKKALFIDLKPLYTFMNSMYFNADRNKYLETTNIGQGAGQWPYTFAERPQQMPTVTKTVTFDVEPTCVFMAPYSKREDWRQAWIGFANGKVRVYNTGGVNDTGNAAAKVEVASFDVGPNPTKITWTKEKARNPSTQSGLVPDHTRTLQICVRGEAAIKWYDMTSTTTAVLRRTFQDSRVVDPVSIIDTDNHGGEHYVTAIADYAGRKVHNVRWGDMIMWTYPEQTRLRVGQNGTDPFEYCGSFPVRGFPFEVNSANVS